MPMQHFIPKIDTKVRGELRIEGRRYKGRKFTVKGKEVELYKIGVLAHALDKTSQTIELWEKSGEFPKPMYKISGAGLGHCRRWYSKEQILNIQTVWRHFPYRKGYPASRKEFFGTIKQVFYQTELVKLKIGEKDGTRAADTGKPTATSDAPRGDVPATGHRVQRNVTVDAGEQREELRVASPRAPHVAGRDSSTD